MLNEFVKRLWFMSVTEALRQPIKWKSILILLKIFTTHFVRWNDTRGN